MAGCTAESFIACERTCLSAISLQTPEGWCQSQKSQETTLLAHFNGFSPKARQPQVAAKKVHKNMKNFAEQASESVETIKRTDKRKQSLYFPEDMLKEIQLEANRQDRSLSWIVQQSWKLSRNEIMRFPSVNDVMGADDLAGRHD